MDINFTEQTVEGTIEFSGALDKNEVDFLLRYALLSLLSKGVLPPTVIIRTDNEDIDDDELVSPEKLN